MPGLRDLAPIVLIIALAAFILIFSSLVLQNLQANPAAKQCVPYTENITLINATAVPLTHQYVCTTPTVRANATMLTNTEYTFARLNSPDTSQITLDNDTWNGTSSEVNYTYDTRLAYPMKVIDNVIGSFLDFSNWFGLLILVIVAGIIISLLINSFSGRDVK